MSPIKDTRSFINVGLHVNLITLAHLSYFPPMFLVSDASSEKGEGGYLCIRELSIRTSYVIVSELS